MELKEIVGLDKDTVLINRYGIELPVDDSATTPIIDDQGKVIGAVMVFRDVVERKKYEEKIRFYAFHDTLTGLPNRRFFQDRLTIALANSKRNGVSLALLFLDAEGVETERQSLFLKEKGCNEDQGYYFGKPVPAKEFEKVIEK